ncbi:MAG TPA: MBL fold metallo-hydrolase [Anaeromyxobacter sp.]|nr:MBL fold metallo-hydrolase [Anaeromyxobacter sp.]
MLVVRSVTVGPFAENAWLAGCDRTGEALLIDPGDEISRVVALAEPGGFRVTRILLTHGHIDHVAGAAEAAARTGAPVQIHAADERMLAQLPAQAALFGFPPSLPPSIAHRHVHGERFQVGEQEAAVLHVPGHTPGGCAVYFAAARELFVGDTLFAGSVGRTDLPGGDSDALARSIRGVLFALGDEVRVHCGHGPSTTIGEERRDNPFVGERGGILP